MAKDLRSLARRMLENGPVKTLPASQRVRALFNGTYIADTTSACYVWEHQYYPEFYIPARDVKEGVLTQVEAIEGPSGSGSASMMKLKVTGGSFGRKDKETDAVIQFKSPWSDGNPVVRFDFGRMDGWLEEDTPIYVHPKDPFKRVDLLASTRKIDIKLDNQLVASSSSAIHLLETGLPTRYYLPLTSVVDPAMLQPSSLRTKCPYKGEAEYYNVVLRGADGVAENLVWYYTRPTVECEGIAGQICFYNEKVDVYVDGVLQPRPKTQFG
ncbi:hypothetical protein BDY21DRAFT_373072 [Lineolata rhizophorae]|uniref:DUF427 domain-containing protein n=1 Tax=Lineolata rhizophorae TaxID=578093 RepID=A0A6A6NW42_9PEZI|nr:hypothetical protein BDY21DRAFT_373072 [Lineolata rhizophorae]